MNMHDERYVLTVSTNGDVRLQDQRTGEIHEFTGARALYDGLGVLADWRERNRGEQSGKKRFACADCSYATVNDGVLKQHQRATGHAAKEI
jgi:hypothetical protein